MAHQILQVNFNFKVSTEEYENLTSSLAQDFAAVPGCVWKIWLVNEERSEAGGIYLFADESSVEAFKSSPLVAAVLEHPALSNVSIKQFGVLDGVSRVTRAPLVQAMAA